MSKPRNPNAFNNMATARISDVTKSELRELSIKSGKTMSEITRWAILEGLPSVRREINKKKK